MTVNVWDVCWRSEKPLTVDEIADELKARGLQLATDAMLLYKEKRPELVGLWTNEAPPDEVLAVAWREYVVQAVKSARETKLLNLTSTETGQPRRNQYTKNRYTANRDKPPHVYRNAMTIERKLVPYDPDHRDQTNQAQTAAMAFLAKVGEVVAQPKLSPAVKELLQLATTAIRARSESA